MKKGIFSKLFVLLLVVGLLFAAAPTTQAQAEPVVVTSEAALLEVLAAGATEIELGANFPLSSTVYVNHSVMIDGKGHSITGPGGDHGLVVTADGVTIKNLQITQSGKSNLQFYLAKDGVVENVTLDYAGNAGMIVNGSEVTISDVITKGNVWGGINVDQGSGVTQEPHLTVLGVGSHTSLEEANPTAAIWVDTGNAAWVTAPVGYAIVPGTPLRFYDNGEFNYLKLYNSYPVHNVTQNSYFTEIQPAVTAANAGDVIELAAGEYKVPAVINLDKAITLTGPTTGEAKVIGAGGVDLSIFNIASSNVTIQNLTLTLESAPESHTALITSPDAYNSNINILNNKIYVEPQAGGMGTWFGQAVWLGRHHTAAKINGNIVYNLRGGIIAHYNNEVEISNNLIYNTKGGIQNYTNSDVDAARRVMSGNSWSTDHNEWDIVWNSGSNTSMDLATFILPVSANNSDAYVVSLAITEPKLNNRSHVFVDATTGTETIKGDNGNINVPYKKVQDGIDAVVPGGTVYVAAGTYIEDLVINKPVTLLGPNADVNPNTGTRGPEAIIMPTVVNAARSVYVTAGNVTIKGFTFDGNNPALDSGIILNEIDVDGKVGIYTYENVGHQLIENNIVKNYEDHGIHLASSLSGENSISDSIVRNNLVDNVDFVGILQNKGHYAQIYDNVITRAYRGIYVAFMNYANPGAEPVVRNNTISAYVEGIWVNETYRPGTYQYQ